MPSKQISTQKPGQPSELYTYLSMVYKLMLGIGIVLAGSNIYKIVTNTDPSLDVKLLTTDAVYYVIAGALFFFAGVLMDKKKDQVILLLTTTVGSGVIYKYLIAGGIGKDMFTLVSILLLGGLYLIWRRGEFKKAKE